MANENLNIDIFANLKGDFKFLKQLQSEGIKGKVELSILSSKGDFQRLEKLRTNGMVIKTELHLLKKGGFSQLEKLKTFGMSIKTEIKLTGAGFKQLEKLQTKGITIPTKFTGDFTPGRSGGAKIARGSKSGPGGLIGPSYLPPELEGIINRYEKTYSDVRAENSKRLKEATANDAFRIKQTLKDRRTAASQERRDNSKALYEATSNDAFRIRQNLKNERDKLAQERRDNSRALYEATANDAFLIRKAQKDNSRSSILRARREARTLKDAQTQVDILPFFSNKSQKREEIADRYGLLPEDLNIPQAPKGAKRIVGKGGFLDPGRIKNTPGAGREIGYAGLFGGVPGAVGAAAGAAIAPGGAFIGGTIAQVAVEKFKQTFEKVKEVLVEVSEAGLQFEESIVGISSVLQATTRVSGPGGRTLSIGDQLGIQTQKARDIQTQARKGLLPLGIGGRTESSLVSAIVTGFAQQGVSLSPDEVSTLARRIGGAIQAQRPDLLNNTNRLRLEVEDAISNPGRLTALTPVLRAFAPNLGKATTGAEAVRFTSGLEAFPQALTQNTDSAVIALRKFNAEIENIKVTFGSELLQTITPALNELVNTIKDSQVQEAMKNAATGLGLIFSTAIRFGSLLVDIGNRLNALDPSGGIAGAGAGSVVGGAVGGTTGIVAGGLGGLAYGASVGAAGGIPGIIIGGSLGALGGAVLGGAVGGGSGALFGGALGAPLGKAAKDELEKRRIEAEKRKAESITNPTASKQLEVFLRTGSVEGIATASELIPDYIEEVRKDRETFLDSQLKDKKLTPEEVTKLRGNIPLELQTLKNFKIDEIIGSALSAYSRERASKSSTIDTFSGFGQFQKTRSDLSFDSQDLVLRQEIVKVREEEVRQNRELLETAENKVTAQANLVTAELKLSEALNDVEAASIKATQTFRGFFSAIETRLSNLLSTVNTSTLAGQNRALAYRGLKLDADSAVIDDGERTGQLSRDEVSLRRGSNNVARENLAFAAELKPLQDTAIFGQATQALINFTNLQTNLNDAFTGLKDAAYRASLALEDFRAGKELRDALNSEKRVEAAKALLASGGSFAEIQGLSFEEGRAASGDASSLERIKRRVSRARFNDTIRETDPDRVKKDDQIAERKLLADQERAKQSVVSFPITKSLTELETLKQLIEFRQIAPEGSKLSESLTKSINKLQSEGDLFKNFPQFGDFQSKLKDQSQVRSDAFTELTKVGTIDSNVQKIVQLLGGNPVQGPKRFKPSDDESGDLSIVPGSDPTRTLPRKFGRSGGGSGGGSGGSGGGSGSGYGPGTLPAKYYKPPSKEDFKGSESPLNPDGFSDSDIERLKALNEKLRTSTSEQEITQAKNEYISILRKNPGLSIRGGASESQNNLLEKLFPHIPRTSTLPTGDVLKSSEPMIDYGKTDPLKVPGGSSSTTLGSGLDATSSDSGPTLYSRIPKMTIPEFTKLIGSTTDTKLRETYYQWRFPPGSGEPNILDQYTNLKNMSMTLENREKLNESIKSTMNPNTVNNGGTLISNKKNKLIKSIKEGVSGTITGGSSKSTDASLINKGTKAKLLSSGDGFFSDFDGYLSGLDADTAAGSEIGSGYGSVGPTNLETAGAYFGEGVAPGSAANIANRASIAAGLFDAATYRDRGQNIIRTFPNSKLSTNINRFKASTGTGISGLPAISPIEGGISGNFENLKNTLGKLAAPATSALGSISGDAKGSGPSNAEVVNKLDGIIQALQNPQGIGEQFSRALKSSFGGAP